MTKGIGMKRDDMEKEEKKNIRQKRRHEKTD